MTVVLTPGQRHEAVVFPQRMEGGVINRAGRRRPRGRPRRIVGDQGYRRRAIRGWARRRGIRITIPRQRNEGRTGPFDRAIYRSRNRIEQLVNRLKPFRRLATRSENHVEHVRARWGIGAILLWL